MRGERPTRSQRIVAQRLITLSLPGCARVIRQTKYLVLPRIDIETGHNTFGSKSGLHATGRRPDA